MNANAFTSILKSNLPEYSIIPITKQSCEQVMGVFDSNQNFFLLTEGVPATLSGCQANVNATPPGFDIQSKLYIGFWINNRCIAVLDMLIGYPSPDCIYIGLFLVHGELQGTGLGHKIIDVLITASKDTGFNNAKLAVIENNKKAVTFWEKLGFEKTGKSSTTMCSGAKVNVITMQLDIQYEKGGIVKGI